VKVVVCGSYGDLEGFLEILRACQEKYGITNVFPNKDHIEKSMQCIFAHHVIQKETENTIATRAKLMESYFINIDTADLVVVRNEKNGNEHYGTGTTIELGYAFARGKKIFFTRQPTNSNVLSLLKSTIKQTGASYRNKQICTV
jgi:nucleoside 2-deoxyribosyltransferase